MDALPEVIAGHIGEVHALCGKYRVKRLVLFGSAVKGTFDPARSDLDFVVEFLPEVDPILYGRGYLGLWRELRQLFGRHVDLVDATTLDNSHFARAIASSRVELYDAA